MIDTTYSARRLWYVSHEAADAAIANAATSSPSTSRVERGRRRIIGSSGSNIGDCLPKEVMEEADCLTRAVLLRAQSLDEFETRGGEREGELSSCYRRRQLTREPATLGWNT